MNNPIFDVPRTNRSTEKVMKFGENITETPTTSSMNTPIKKAGYRPNLCRNMVQNSHVVIHVYTYSLEVHLKDSRVGLLRNLLYSFWFVDRLCKV